MANTRWLRKGIKGRFINKEEEGTSGSSIPSLSRDHTLGMQVRASESKKAQKSLLAIPKSFRNAS